jgi:hypothetical protein
MTDGEHDIIREIEADARETEESARRLEREILDRVARSLHLATVHGIITEEESDEAYLYVAARVDSDNA